MLFAIIFTYAIGPCNMSQRQIDTALQMWQVSYDGVGVPDVVFKRAEPGDVPHFTIETPRMIAGGLDGQLCDGEYVLVRSGLDRQMQIRVLAHEIGHYILMSHAHSVDPNDVMFEHSGGQAVRASRKEMRKVIRLYGKR